jgi:hypothetical protein
LDSVNDFEDVRTALTEYVRAYIRALLARKYNYTEIGKALNCSHAYVSQLHTPEKYPNAKIGHEVEHRLAEVLHGGSIDALRKAAELVHMGGVVIAQDATTGETIALPSGERVFLTADQKPPPKQLTSSIPPEGPKGRRSGTRAR